MKIFLDAVLPVAEKLDVKLALHPNDPPTKVKIYGVPSIMRSREAYERVL
jgi:mannonate dehydratase